MHVGPVDSEGRARLPKHDELLWLPIRGYDSKTLEQGGRDLGNWRYTPARAWHHQKQIAFRRPHRRRLDNEQDIGKINGITKDILSIPDFCKPEEAVSMEKPPEQHELLL